MLIHFLAIYLMIRAFILVVSLVLGFAPFVLGGFDDLFEQSGG